MAILTKTFSQLVGDAVAAIQGGASQLVDLTVGSVLRSFVEAFSACVLWIQGIALQIASLTRFATSNGADADTWGADFGFERLPAQSATGAVTFARFTATMQAIVPVGKIVQTSDGTRSYVVIADTMQGAYVPTLGGYVLAAGVSSCTASVQATVGGAAGNAAAGAVNTFGSSIAGVDTVTNAYGFSNGADAESDTAFRARFVTYIASLSRGTRAAILNAVYSVQLGMDATLTEGFNYAGGTQLGYFYLIVDDGTGAPSSILLSTIYNAVDVVRPVGSTFSMFAPVIMPANITMVLTTDTGYVHSALVAMVDAAIASYLNLLPIGAPLPYSRLAQIAYGASPGVINVTGVTINSGTADLVITGQQVIKSGVRTIT